MLPDLNRVIEQVSKEKGIDRQVIVDALKDAMLSAAKRTYGPEKKIEAQWNPELGEVGHPGSETAEGRHAAPLLALLAAATHAEALHQVREGVALLAA